jgi:hypothetical protein
VSQATEDEVVVEVARELVARTAPQELPVFRATSGAYLDDPTKVLRPRRGKEEMLGFGVEAAAMFVTPVALEIAKSVFSYLATQVLGAVEKETSDAIAKRVHDLFHRRASDAGADATAPASPAGLTREQLAHVHDLALEKARQLALPEAQAGLLADAMVGSLAVA